MPKTLFIAVFLVLVTALQVLPFAAAAADQAPALTRAIQAAQDDPDIPFHLEVDCTDDEASRSLKVFRGEIAVWNRERQITLDSGKRRVLLELLFDARFPDFGARYGGRPKADKEEAALRVSCRIHLSVGGLQKTSVQLFEGEQSAELLGLAGKLLDRIAPHAADGVGASDLEDGLAKLANGALAPELLEFRLLWLPRDTETQAGFILRVQGGDISRQAYAPGRLVEAPDRQRIASCQMSEMLAALMVAKVWNLPVNLQREGLTELEVAVLGHRKTVIARSSFRSGGNDAQTGFEVLMAQLELQPAGCVAPRTSNWSWQRCR